MFYLVPTQRKTKTIHKSSDSLSSPGFHGVQREGEGINLGFSHPSSVHPFFPILLCFEIGGLSIYKIIGPRKGREEAVGRVVVDVIPGHNRFCNFNLRESKEVLLVRCLCPWLAEGRKVTEIIYNV